MSPAPFLFGSSRREERLTLLVGLLVLVAAGSGLLVPGFYRGNVDPRYATGILTADGVSLVSLPVLAACLFLSRRGSPAATLVWTSLVAYFTYAYATYAFDRMYTFLFPLYMLIFGLGCFTTVLLLTRLDVKALAGYVPDLPWRRLTAGFLMLTGIILYGIELPVILGRIPGGVEAGGTPFMVLDMALIAPLALLTGMGLWQRHPWGMAVAGIFLVKAIALMTGFLIADYYDWYLGKLASPAATLIFTAVCVLAYFFTWNYFSAFKEGHSAQERTSS